MKAVTRGKIKLIAPFLALLIWAAIAIGINLSNFSFWLSVFVICFCLAQIHNYFAGEAIGLIGPGFIRKDAEKVERAIGVILLSLLVGTMAVYNLIELFMEVP